MTPISNNEEWTYIEEDLASDEKVIGSNALLIFEQINQYFMQKFVQNIITFSLRHTTLVMFGVFVLLFGGIYALKHTPIEAFPDVTNTRARIIIQWPGRSAE